MASDERQTLIAELARSDRFESFVLIVAVPFAVLRAVGIEPLSRRGRLLTGLAVFGVLFSAPLAMAVVTGTVRLSSPLLGWLAVAALESLVTVFVPTDQVTMLVDTAARYEPVEDLDALRRFLKIQRRWQNLPSNVVTSTLAAAALAWVSFTLIPGDWSEVAPGSLLILLIVFYWTGEMVWAAAITAVLARLESLLPFRLRSYHAKESPWVRRYLATGRRGSAVIGGVCTLYMVMVALVLPWDLELVLPVTAMVLICCYGSIIVQELFDRRELAYIICNDRRRRLDELDSQIDSLIARVPELGDQDERRLAQLRMAHETVAEERLDDPSPHPAGQVARAVLIPTLTFMGLAVAEGYVQRLADVVLEPTRPLRQAILREPQIVPGMTEAETSARAGGLLAEARTPGGRVRAARLAQRLATRGGSGPLPRRRRWGLLETGESR